MAKRFTELTYESFEKTLKPFCKGIIEVMNAQGVTVKKNLTAQYLDSKILLVSGLDQDEVTQFEEGDGIKSTGIGKDSLSVFRNGGKISPWITAAYAGKDRFELEKMVRLHFESELSPFLLGARLREAKNAIYNIILVDKEIPERELATLKESFSDDNDYLFLAKSFIFAMIRDSLPDNEIPTNPAVEQVLQDIKTRKSSTLLNGLIDSIYYYAVDGYTIFDLEHYYQEDIIKFVLGVLPIADKELDAEHRKKFIDIRMRALSYEINNDHMTGIASALNRLFKKYWIGEKNFKVSNIHWDDEDHANTLDIQFKNEIKKPIIIGRADLLSKIKSKEDYAELFGVSVDDLWKYGFNDEDFRGLPGNDG